MKIIDIGILNEGTDDAFDPEIRILPRLGSEAKEEPMTGMFTCNKSALMIDYQRPKTVSNDPDETELAEVFLKEGLRPTPLIAGSTAHYFVFGFAFKEEKNFHIASEEVLSILSLPFGTNRSIPFEIIAKARNASNAVIYKRVFLNLPNYQNLSLIPVTEAV